MMKRNVKVVVLSLFAVLSLGIAYVAVEGQDQPAKSIRPDTGKIEEKTSAVKLPDPTFGYEGHLGCFVATKESARCMIVVHQYPDTAKIGLGNTTMTYDGVIQLNNVPGYCFKTEFDGKNYPSKVFLSGEKVYFGGGITGYIAADYREETGWAWKLIPLRAWTLSLPKANAATSCPRSTRVPNSPRSHEWLLCQTRFLPSPHSRPASRPAGALNSAHIMSLPNDSSIK